MIFLDPIISVRLYQKSQKIGRRR